MKSVGSLQTHLDEHVHQLAVCWILTPVGGTPLYFTSHDQDLVVDGQTYVSVSGFNASAVSSKAGLQVDNLEARTFFAAAGITQVAVEQGTYDGATVQMFAVNYANPAQGQLKLRKGFLGEVSYGRQELKVELRGLLERFTREIVEVYTPGCRADLGDARCTVNLASFTATGTLTGVTSNRIFADSARTETDAYFMGGLLTWTSGNNAGRKMEVKKWTNSSKTFELVLPMYSTVQVGDSYAVYAGCDKTLETCRDRFNNVVNFRGEPYVPNAPLKTEKEDATVKAGLPAPLNALNR